MMRKFVLFLFCFVICICPLSVYATDVTEVIVETDVYEPPMMFAAAATPLKWSNTYNCVVPDVDGSYPYIAIIASGYGGGTSGVVFSSTPIKRITHLTTNYQGLVIDGDYYYKGFGDPDNGAITNAYEWLFSKDSLPSATSLANYDSVGGSYNNEPYITIHWTNHPVESTNNKTGEITIIPTKWVVASSESEYESFANWFAIIWEKLADIKLTIFGVEINGQAVLVGPFFMSFSLLLLSKMFGIGSSAGAFAVRTTKNHMSRRSVEKKERRD